MATIHFHKTTHATPEQFVERGKNLKGRLLAAFLGTAGTGALSAAFDDTDRAADARYDDALVC